MESAVVRCWVFDERITDLNWIGVAWVTSATLKMHGTISSHNCKPQLNNQVVTSWLDPPPRYTIQARDCIHSGAYIAHRKSGDDR